MLTEGKTAYNAYCKATGGVSLISGDKLPEFESLKSSIQDAWVAAETAGIQRGLAQSRNYVADKGDMPTSVLFSNGRRVKIVTEFVSEDVNSFVQHIYLDVDTV